MLSILPSRTIVTCCRRSRLLIVSKCRELGMARQHGTYGVVGNGTMAEYSESSEVLFEASELGVSRETRPLLQRKFEEKKHGE